MYNIKYIYMIYIYVHMYIYIYVNIFSISMMYGRFSHTLRYITDINGSRNIIQLIGANERICSKRPRHKGGELGFYPLVI